MSDYKNIKVEINKEQPLDEVVRELERLGYNSNCVYFGCDSKIKTVTTSKQTKSYEKSTVGNIGVLPQILTTLSELKEMCNEF